MLSVYTQYTVNNKVIKMQYSNKLIKNLTQLKISIFTDLMAIFQQESRVFILSDYFRRFVWNS